MGHGDSHRANWRISGAVFSGLFAISTLDGLVDHPGDHDVPGASMACSPDWQKARAGFYHSGDSGPVVNRPSDVAANEFICGFRSAFRHSGATEHSANTSSTRGTKAVADSRPQHLRHVVKGSCRPPCTRSEHAAQDGRFGSPGALDGGKNWREHVVVPGFLRRCQHHDGLRRQS